MTATTERPHWFSRLDTSGCQEHFDKVEAFAKESGRHEQFMSRLGQLVWSDIEDDALAYWGTPIADMRVRLFYDFAPHSFEFVREIKDVSKDEWRRAVNGGLIFHGPHDNGGGGGAPTFSVNLTPQDGWSIHT